MRRLVWNSLSVGAWLSSRRLQARPQPLRQGVVRCDTTRGKIRVITPPSFTLIRLFAGRSQDFPHLAAQSPNFLRGWKSLGFGANLPAVPVTLYLSLRSSLRSESECESMYPAQRSRSQIERYGASRRQIAWVRRSSVAHSQSSHYDNGKMNGYPPVASDKTALASGKFAQAARVLDVGSTKKPAANLPVSRLGRMSIRSLAPHAGPRTTSHCG